MHSLPHELQQFKGHGLHTGHLLAPSIISVILNHNHKAREAYFTNRILIQFFAETDHDDDDDDDTRILVPGALSRIPGAARPFVDREGISCG